MPTLHIQLFGCFQFFADHQPITTITKRGQILLAYLLLHRDQLQTRETLAFLLWPETNDVQARTNLRTELTRLRRALVEFDRYILDEQGLLQWRPDVPFTLDVMAFEQALQCSEQALQTGDTAGAVAAWQTAIQLYRGDLLTKLYEDWILHARQQLADQFANALTNLSTLLKTQGDYSQAIYYAQRLLRYDPLHEAAYHQLMEIYALNGDHTNVKRVYKACAVILQRELAVPPSPLTQKLYQTIFDSAGGIVQLGVNSYAMQ